MTYPRRRSVNNSVPESQTRKMTTAPTLSGAAGEIPRTMSSVICSDITRIESSDVIVSSLPFFMECRGSGVSLIWLTHTTPLRRQFQVPPGNRSIVSGRSKPADQGIDKASLGLLTHPRHVPVGPNQYAGWSRDDANRGKLQRAVVLGVDQLDTI